MCRTFFCSPPALASGIIICKPKFAFLQFFQVKNPDTQKQVLAPCTERRRTSSRISSRTRGNHRNPSWTTAHGHRGIIRRRPSHMGPIRIRKTRAPRGRSRNRQNMPQHQSRRRPLPEGRAPGRGGPRRRQQNPWPTFRRRPSRRWKNSRKARPPPRHPRRMSRRNRAAARERSRNGFPLRSRLRRKSLPAVRATDRRNRPKVTVTRVSSTPIVRAKKS